MFNLNPQSGIPIYRQLYEQVKRLVTAGQLKPGEALPSVRELAVRHSVNPMTISKAYNLLEADGVLVRHRGKPMTVATAVACSPEELLQPLLSQFIQSARQLHLRDAQVIDIVNKGLKKQHD
ncbi:MAG: GntR family transcriptional regulator [Pseudomonadota bacterium]|uniref:GntR family transcriptional regulator n=1 Tax=Gallaecimonas pentaromativorans TaxID=584787 RepID=UPI00067E7B4F|nr:GntR family transcriptional regulator [Gallaecimonas pentaromativorans]MED5526309.1 GntR family transcriptional regulator [Pseudomonadota bacterium]